MSPLISVKHMAIYAYCFPVKRSFKLPYKNIPRMDLVCMCSHSYTYTLRHTLSTITAVVHAGPCLSQCLINALVEPAPRGALERHPLTFTARGQRCSLNPASLFTHLSLSPLSSFNFIFSSLLLSLPLSPSSLLSWFSIFSLFLTTCQ